TPQETACAKNTTSVSCVRTELADGSVVYRLHADNGGGAVNEHVEVYRTDGTMIMISLSNFRMGQDLREPGRPTFTVTRAGSLLTADELLRIAQTPALTLFP